MLTTSLGLHQRLLQNLKRQTVALDIHLGGGQTVACTCGLEVHVAQVVLVAKNVTEHGILLFAGVLDQSHSNTADGLLHGNTSIHQGQRAGADGSHGAGTVRLQNLAHQTYGVREVLGNLTLQSAPCQVAVTNLTTAYRGEVIVEQEALIALVEHIVNQLLVELGTQRTGRERLCLTTGEDSASVRHGQGRDLAPDGADLVCLTSVETNALVKDATAHGIAFHVVVVAVHHGLILVLRNLRSLVNFLMLSKEFLLEVLQQLLESLGALLLLKSLLGDVVGGLVELLVHLLTQGLVVHLVVILTLHVLAQFLGELGLQLTHGLDGGHGSLQGTNHVLLAHFLHLAFHHHDVLSRSTNHDVHVGLFHLVEGRVNDILTVNTGHAHLTDGALEGDI